VTKPRFGIHPALEDALAAIVDDELPADIDSIVPAQRRMTSDELITIGRLCATHVTSRVGKTQRAEFARLTALVDRFLARPPAGPNDQTAWRDLGAAARRDAEYARGPLKVIALTAWAASESGPDASRLVGQAARIAVKLLANDRAARDALVRELCVRFG
jgi:hypothetical protein